MATVLVGNRCAGFNCRRELERGDYPFVFVRMFSPLFLPLLYSNMVRMVSDNTISKVLFPHSNCCFTPDIAVCDLLGIRVVGAIWQEVNLSGVLPKGEQDLARLKPARSRSVLRTFLTS